MTEWLKTVLRWVLFWIPGGGEFYARPGTPWYRFLDWLYGNGEPEFPVVWPDDNEEKKP